MDMARGYAVASRASTIISPTPQPWIWLPCGTLPAPTEKGKVTKARVRCGDRSYRSNNPRDDLHDSSRLRSAKLLMIAAPQAELPTHESGDQRTSMDQAGGAGVRYS